MILGFDVGGSSIKSVVMFKNRVKAERIETLPKNFEDFVGKIIEIKNDFEKQFSKKAKKIGFSLPGPLDKKRKKIILCPNIPYLKQKPILEILKKKLDCDSIRIEHDINCFLLAEIRFGLAKKYKNIFYLALGTGLGSAALCDGKLVIGHHGSAGEFGQTICDFKKGVTLEDLCSGRFLRKKLKKDVSSIIEAAENGNQKSLEAFSRLGENLGIGLSNVINTYNPEAIFISGGISKAKPFFISEMETAIKKFVVSKDASKTKIFFSRLGRFGAAKGALLLFPGEK